MKKFAMHGAAFRAGSFVVLGVLAQGVVAGAPVLAPAAPPEVDEAPLHQLGPGDSVSLQVYGRPDMTTTTYVSDDGSISVPLAGTVTVAGLSPAQAQQRVSDALRQGQYLVDPHVTITLAQSQSQQVSVLGEVRTPGRYGLQAKTTVFDLLALAGGATADGADTVFLLRTDGNGKLVRYPVDLRGLSDDSKPVTTVTLKGGDSIFVPRAERFYIYGEVTAPNMYRLERDMTVIQAISRSGGITARGSDSRIEIRRRGADGRERTIDAAPTDRVQADDVIRVKERIF
jgi:polysaccharide export outer membrane protein